MFWDFYIVFLIKNTSTQKMCHLSKLQLNKISTIDKEGLIRNRLIYCSQLSEKSLCIMAMSLKNNNSEIKYVLIWSFTHLCNTRVFLNWFWHHSHISPPEIHLSKCTQCGTELKKGMPRLQRIVHTPLSLASVLHGSFCLCSLIIR